MDIKLKNEQHAFHVRIFKIQLFSFKKEPIEGYCQMAINALSSANMNFKTKDSCKRVCNAEPKCLYYFHGLQAQSCEMYPDAQKSCTAIIGRLDIEKCDKSKFKFCFYLPTTPIFIFKKL